MNFKKEKTMKELLNSFTEKKEIHQGYSQESIRKFWAENMGEMINKYTDSIDLKRKTLNIKISSAPLRQELQYSRGQILKLLQEKFGNEMIHSIRIY